MDSESVYNIDYLVEIAGKDDGFIREMLKTFLENAPVELELMHKFYERRDYPNLKECAHKFLTTITYVGARYLEPELSKIELYALNQENLMQIPSLIQRVDNAVKAIIEKINLDYNL